jgi:2-polyprenyl-6-hydroxyphenyl methylase/3-demethylubiquinone-9 3-methyltransferase
MSELTTNRDKYSMLGGIHIDDTVDHEDAQRYDSLSSKWWNKEGPFWPLHRLNDLRVDYLLKNISVSNTNPSRTLEGMHCLDVGCGGGLLSEGLARLGANVTGIDVVEKNICAARRHANESGLNIDYRFASAGELCEYGEQFDWVFNMEVVEHVDNYSEFMSQCCRLTRPGGHMAVATINRTFASYITAIIGAEYVLRWLPKGTHQWKNFRRPDEVSDSLLKGGFSVYERRGVSVNPITREFSLTNSSHVNYMLFANKAA